MSNNIHNYFFVNLQEKDIKEFVEKSIIKAHQVKPLMKKTDIYKQLIRDWYNGKYGDIGLQQVCLENQVDYQQVIKYRKSVDNEKV